jgi:hypothetical protein
VRSNLSHFGICCAAVPLRLQAVSHQGHLQHLPPTC